MCRRFDLFILSLGSDPPLVSVDAKSSEVQKVLHSLLFCLALPEHRHDLQFRFSSCPLCAQRYDRPLV